MMKIRQNVLDHARKNSIRYVFFVDTDNFLTNPDTLNVLLSRKKTIVGPMLRVTAEVAYSNYWAGTEMSSSVLNLDSTIKNRKIFSSNHANAHMFVMPSLKFRLLKPYCLNLCLCLQE